MKINFDRYVEITLKDIEINREVISRSSINILIKAINKINIFLDHSKVDLLFDKDWLSENKLFNSAEFFILKSNQKKLMSKESQPAESIDYNIPEIRDFFAFFPSCEASIVDVKATELRILHNVATMSASERIEKMRTILKNTKKMAMADKITKEMADKIGTILTELCFISRLEMFTYIENLRKNEKINIDTETEASNPSGLINMKTISYDIIHVIVKILGKEREEHDIFDFNIHFSDKSLIAHSNRVFLNFVDFLYYYNNEFNNKALSARVRIEFQDKFLHYYKKIFEKFSPKRANITSIQEATKMGLRALSFEEICDYGRSAFWHDLAKLYNVDYLAPEGSEQQELAKRHVFNGYYLSRYTGKPTLNAIMILGLHHEYYGHGYGVFSKMYAKKKSMDPNFDIPYIMTYDSKDMEQLSSVAFFPAKILEIIDVYDVLLFPSKGIDRKPMTPNEAISYMRDIMIEETLKLDPIIFNLFVSFLKNVKGGSPDLVEI